MNPESRIRVGRDDWAPAALLVVMCAVIALLRSAMFDLQGDEVWTRLEVRLPLAETLPFVVRDGKHPPFYPALQWLLGHVLGDAPTGLRLISIAAGAMIPPVIFLVGRQLEAPVMPSLAAALWAGWHPLLLEHSINARSYALFAFIIALYAAALVFFLGRPRRAALLVLSVTAAAATLTHAFGLPFILSGLTAGVLWLLATGGPGRMMIVRRLLVAHAPACLLLVAWLLFVSLSLGGASGIAGGLAWVDRPSMTERLYTLGVLLGNAGFHRSTLITFATWSLLGAMLAVAIRGRRRMQVAVAIAGLAVLAPFVAQNLVSGIVADVPIWGDRHVIPVVPTTALALVASFVPGVLPAWWSRAAGGLLLGLGVLSITANATRSDTFLSDAVAHFRQLPPNTALRLTYGYGDVNVANYYLDRRCLDDFQLRTMFPDVKGPPDETDRLPWCVAKTSQAPSGGSRSMLFVYRTFAPGERRQRASLVSEGWRVLYEFESSSSQRAAVVLVR